MKNTTQKKSVLEKLDEMFPIVYGSQLSMDDKFMAHCPNGSEQKRLKSILVEGIENGLPDFRLPRVDPSFDEEENLNFEEGRIPAVGKFALWWKNSFENFLPEKNSRMATVFEYDIFCGVLIKNLVEEGYDVEKAWYYVCDESCKLGNFWDSHDSRMNFEPTGSRAQGIWTDLGNTQKVLINSEGTKFFIASGSYCNSSKLFAISKREELFYRDYIAKISTGLMAMDV